MAPARTAARAVSSPTLECHCAIASAQSKGEPDAGIYIAYAAGALLCWCLCVRVACVHSLAYACVRADSIACVCVCSACTDRVGSSIAGVRSSSGTHAFDGSLFACIRVCVHAVNLACSIARACATACVHSVAGVRSFDSVHSCVRVRSIPRAPPSVRLRFAVALLLCSSVLCLSSGDPFCIIFGGREVTHFSSSAGARPGRHYPIL